MPLLPKDSELGWTPYAWLIYLVPFLITPAFSSHPSMTKWIATLIAAAIFFVLYLRGYWARGRELMLIMAAITVLGIVCWPWNRGAGAFFIYAAAFAGQLELPRTSIRAIAIIATIALLQAFFLRIEIFNAAWPVVFTVLVGAINMHFTQVGRSNARLRLAHDEIEHLAKVAERERIARDLHDLLGHTLSLIVLKSELAVKLSERDPERARSEIRDVERISRDALAQVRSAVRGYRTGGLQAELDAAREALAAAGVTLAADLPAMTIPASHEAVLAMALRESITNVVRHAYAKHCAIALTNENGRIVLIVRDDGRGSTSEFGIGLTGMRERVEALGGTVTRDSVHGTTLTIFVPLPAPVAIGERTA
ncbi:MAG TPA: sensor histidine kinase [Thermoanaerobaculia bacterium]|nr:sensor histidine kinase [Thermoanaerobaculia bacterium]